MFINEQGIQEVNQYYARRGGFRTANISNYVNPSGAVPPGGFAGYIRSAAAKDMTPVSESSQEDTNKESTVSSASDSKANGCCEQCRLTSQLALQMMSRSLYSSSGLGLGTGLGLDYSFAGTSALSAYQKMMNLIGSQS